MKNNVNIKIMKDKPPLTDEEIRSHMDFDSLLNLHKTGVGSSGTPSKWLKIAGYTALTVLITTSVIYSLWPSENVTKENKPVEETAVVQTDSAPVQDPKIETSRNEAQPTVVLKQAAEPVTNQPQPVQEFEQSAVPTLTQAEPIDGYPELYGYFNRELRYPTDALKDSLEGVVSVSFAINEQGKPSDIRITNSLGELFDLECKRVIEAMPAWKAASVNGTPISTRMSIPLTFRITRN